MGNPTKEFSCFEGWLAWPVKLGEGGLSLPGLLPWRHGRTSEVGGVGERLNGAIFQGPLRGWRHRRIMMSNREVYKELLGMADLGRIWNDRGA